MPSPQQLYDTVARALDSNDIRRAIGACRELNTRFPDYFPGWCIAGEIHHHLNKPEAGLVAAQRALELRPGDIGALLQQVDCLLALERIEAARAILLDFENRPIDSAATHDQIGRLLASQDLHRSALGHYRKALALQPDKAELWYNLATAQRFLGLIEEAEHSLDKALELEPLDFESLAMRSSLRRQTAESNHIEALQSALEDPALQEGGKVNIHYALAKEYDDLGDYPRSFAHLAKGAGTRRRHMRYAVDTDLKIIAAIKHSFDADFFEGNGTGFASSEPVFILGMPRTGTTLLERILGSHSAVHSAGELDTFGREMMRLASESANVKALSRTDLARLSSHLDMEKLGRAYIEGTRPLTGQTPHFIDKLPFNFLYAGLIHRALPRAKIINLTRHPMATCYAIYKQLFRDAYPFSYDLEDLGKYYVAYHQLMSHWHEVMPGVIYPVAYEQLVAETEDETRKLLAYLGLDWEEQCLHFYANRQASTTASAAQVRQPVYSSSLEHWRHYDRELEPLKSILNAAGIDTG